MSEPAFISAGFAASLGVCGMTTARRGGASEGPYAGLNLATHVNDDPAKVMENRRRLRAAISLDTEPLWLDQHHGTQVFLADESTAVTAPPRADAAVCRVPGRVLALLTADCLPVLLAAADQRVIGVAHAGWRGLASGVLENTVKAMGASVNGIHAWLGPAIGRKHFEVGSDVYDAFVSADAGAKACFVAHNNGKWLADLAGLASRRLERIGVTNIEYAGRCTFSEPENFYSYRRDGECGRMASLLWMVAD